MSPIYEFQCPNGHIHDRLVDSENHRTQPCPACGELSERLLSLPQRPIVRDGTPTHFPKERP